LACIRQLVSTRCKHLADSTASLSFSVHSGRLESDVVNARRTRRSLVSCDQGQLKLRRSNSDGGAGPARLNLDQMTRESESMTWGKTADLGLTAGKVPPVHKAISLCRGVCNSSLVYKRGRRKQ
jgi:hypothetical protein